MLDLLVRSYSVGSVGQVIVCRICETDLETDLITSDLMVRSYYVGSVGQVILRRVCWSGHIVSDLLDHYGRLVVGSIQVILLYYGRSVVRAIILLGQISGGICRWNHSRSVVPTRQVS